MKKSIASILMIFLFIGMALTPICTARTSLNDIETNEEFQSTDYITKIFIRAHIKGTVELVPHMFIFLFIVAPVIRQRFFVDPWMKLKDATITVKNLLGEDEVIEFPNENFDSIEIISAFAVWNSLPEPQEGENIYHVDGTLFFGSIDQHYTKNLNQ